MTAHDAIIELKQRIGQSIIGQDLVVERLLLTLLCNGNVLVEGLPGLAKTRAVKSLAKNLEADFSRIQFTPDLLPSDITGSEMYLGEEAKERFLFQPGPIFANIVLADEVNRAPAKVQAALLEAMEERQITVDGVTYPMELPFLVLATQNPIEYEGTFPLPEAQLDRFMLRISLGYPSNEDETIMLDRQQYSHPVTRIEQVVSAEELIQAQRQIREIFMNDLVKEYIVRLVNATRRHPDVYLGASPRGSWA